jgi:thiol-disulfide isomerase/thioredoxin
MDFSEGALISTPVFHPKLKTYFEDVVPPLIDSIIKYADSLIEKAKDNQELFKYIVWYITNKYERSQYVSHDAVFVHMVQKYYAKGLCPWTDEAVLERMINQANKLDDILIGRKAPELYMADTNGVFHSNYEFNRKYTIMWFWDLNCGHCKSATPKLVEFYNRAKDSLDFDVYAVCMTVDSVKWKQAIIERQLPWLNVGGNVANIDYRVVYDINTTPVLFVLDKEKKIIVKKIGIDELEPFLRHYDEGKIKH